MKTSTVAEFRSKMNKRLQEIEDDQDMLILSRRGSGFVVLTLERYNAMEEMNHLLSTTANTVRLMESMAQDKAGNYVTLESKWKAIGNKTGKTKKETSGADVQASNVF